MAAYERLWGAGGRDPDKVSPDLTPDEVLARLAEGAALTRRVDDQTVADLVRALWIVAESWLAFAEIDGVHPDADHGTRLLRVVLEPYLTPDGGNAGLSAERG